MKPTLPMLAVMAVTALVLPGCNGQEPLPAPGDSSVQGDGVADATVDAPRPDSATPDATAPDIAAPDIAAPDTAAPDSMMLDTMTPDMMAPDMMMPDSHVPDSAVPDVMVPDVMVPDVMVPDVMVPDMPLPTCTDGLKNGDETDTDCGGGTCPACANTKKCINATDCASGNCQLGVCQAPTCSDNVKNGTETDIDCGGSACKACVAGKGCAKGADCASGVCSWGKCAASSCTDKVKNGAETDVDCGGGTCPACAVGKVCSKGTDCAGLCSSFGKCVWAQTCKELHTKKSTLASGVYTLDPDGVGTVPALKTYCDMSYGGGGWTLYYSALAKQAKPTEGDITPGTSKHLSAAAVKALATLSSQVHIRTRNKAATRSVTSKAGTAPILNLRKALILNNVKTNIANWSGPMAPKTYLWSSCAVSGSYPDYTFWACGNSGGLHLNRGATQSRWIYVSASGPNEDMEVYVR